MPPLLLPPCAGSFATSAHARLRNVADLLPDGFHVGLNKVRDFRHKFGRYPHLLHPRTFNEKLLARQIFDRRPQLCMFADKHAVREYVSRKLGPGVLTTVYHVTSNASEIPFDMLPSRYVVKPTHGSGWVYFVKDASKLDRQELVARCKYWLAVNYYDICKEWAYKDVPPRIMFEEFLDGGNGTSPADYKFFVFGGKVRAIQVDLDRHTQHKRNLYTLDWLRMNCTYVYESAAAEIPRPAQLQTMIEYAETLSDGIDFVRVDLYDVARKIYFGELTNIPESALGKFMPQSWDGVFGDFWELPSYRPQTWRAASRRPWRTSPAPGRSAT